MWAATVLSSKTFKGIFKHIKLTLQSLIFLYTIFFHVVWTSAVLPSMDGVMGPVSPAEPPPDGLL